MTISKELLTKVLGEHCRSYDVETQLLFYTDEHDSSVWVELNIYELMYLCKEWARKHYYYLPSYTGALGGTCSIDYGTKTIEIIIGDDSNFTEPEAVFKACEWILKEIQK